MGDNGRDKVIRLGLIGYPLDHSLSPRIHKAALRALDIKGEYLLYPIPPTRDGEISIEGLLNQTRNGQVLGVNVTIPHKQTVIPYLDQLTPTARSIGAVNTIFYDGQYLMGDNTDAPAFLKDLDRFTRWGIPTYGESSSATQRTAVVLGAGGAARAVVYALSQAGWRVTIAARRVDQAQELIDGFHQSAFSGQLSAIKLDEASFLDLINNISLIVNATPLGMDPHVDRSPWPAGIRLPTDALVYDLVYNPLETVFVRSARGAGLLATTGLGMLVEQAALAFERWTGRMAPRDIMRQAAQGG